MQRDLFLERRGTLRPRVVELTTLGALQLVLLFGLAPAAYRLVGWPRRMMASIVTVARSTIAVTM